MSGSEIALSIPIGGWHPLLPAALRSIAIQSAPIQIAVLDASGDFRVAQALDNSGLDFKYRREGRDGGQAAAIAEGWRNVGGDVLGWLNVDDLLVPGSLRTALQTLEAEPVIDAVFGDSVIIGLGGEVLGVHGQVGDVGDHIAVVNSISQPSCFFRRKAVERVGGLNEALGFSMDWELWIRMHKAGSKFKRLPKFFSAVYWGEGTKTSELSISRLSELFSHTLEYAGLAAALRMLIGVYTQAIVASEGLRSVIGDPARRRAGARLLLSADWNIREASTASAILPLINPTSSKRSGYCVEFDGEGEVLPGDNDVAKQMRPGLWRVRLGASVPPGGAAQVRLASPGAAARLRRIEWDES